MAEDPPNLAFGDGPAFAPEYRGNLGFAPHDAFTPQAEGGLDQCTWTSRLGADCGDGASSIQEVKDAMMHQVCGRTVYFPHDSSPIDSS